jgi:hypothetical protein
MTSHTGTKGEIHRGVAEQPQAYYTCEKIAAEYGDQVACSHGLTSPRASRAARLNLGRVSIALPSFSAAFAYHFSDVAGPQAVSKRWSTCLQNCAATKTRDWPGLRIASKDVHPSLLSTLSGDDRKETDDENSFEIAR